ncbi:TPA: hypothetical protein DIV48_00590 [Candidatus Kaiserbacteria bacterium]|nr:MAG: hypothetical protein UY93_C0002G0421 [Parcubacteria group bacterium GW2011_GWA1_56_13]KKW45675.1 MAG: hypothetical protein UY97_C0017G0005 [Parcubacteria group bacterium GW2011_GWB1_57_6]HCR52129.1 hypothetical protein [Candidatus Kaiserbacteria bacterium]
MKVSIVISIYNSHGAFARQLAYFKKMNPPNDVEFIFVDDGSDPPLQGEMKNMRILQTHNNLAWTQGLGRNLGASQARGEYLFMTDLDHIISREALEATRAFTGNKMIFRRQIALLLSDGTLTQDRKALTEFGYSGERMDASVHGNTFVMKKEIFDQLGGYAPETCTLGYHPASKKGDDCYFNGKWNRAFAGTAPVLGPDIYLFPIGRFHDRKELNPGALFHNLSQEKQVSFMKK